MKKSLLAIAALAIAMTASAATTMETSTRSFTPTNAKVNVNSFRSNSPFAQKAKKVRAKVSSASELAGTYIETNIPVTSDSYYSAGTTTVTATGDSITFKNFAGISDTYSFDVKAKVDAANGTFTIPSGSNLYKSSSYGNCQMYCISIDDQGTVTKTTDPIQGVIQDDGSMVITSMWACFIVTGQYAGYYFSDLMFQGNFFNKPNARMTYNQTGKGAKNVMLYVEQTDSAVMLSNFADFGCVVSLEKNADSTVVIPKQYVLDQGDTYGIFFTIGYNAAGDTTANITGTGAGHPAQINLTNAWTLLSTTGYWINKCTDTKIFFSDENGGVSTTAFFTYPHELTGVKDVTAEKVVAGKHYVNLQGQVSNEPFEGVNIVVTRYSDGSQSATKMLK